MEEGPLQNTIINNANENNTNNTNNNINISANVDNSVIEKQVGLLEQLTKIKNDYNNIPLKLDFDDSEITNAMTTITQISQAITSISKGINETKIEFDGLEDVKNQLSDIINITKNFDKDGIAGKDAENDVLKLSIAVETLNNKLKELGNNCGDNNNLEKFFNDLGEKIEKITVTDIPELLAEVNHLTNGMERINEAAKFNTGNTIFDVFLNSIQKVKPGINGILQDIQEVRDINNETISIDVSIDSGKIKETLTDLFPKSDNNNNGSLKEIDDIAKQKVNELLIGYTKSLNINVNTKGINNMNIVGKTSDVFADTKKKYQKIYDSVIDALNAQQQDLENQLENISSANDDKRLSIEAEINNIKSQKENLEETLKKNIQDDIKSIASQYSKVIIQYHQNGSFDMNAYDSVGAIKSTTGNTNKSFEHLYKSLSDMNILSGTDANKDIDKILDSKNVNLGSVIKSTKSALGSTKFLSDRLDNGRIMGNIQKAKETGDTELLKQSMAELNPVIDEFDKLKTVAGNISDILKIDANGNKEIEALQKAVRQVLNNILSFGLAIGETRDSIKETINDLDEGSLKEELKNELKNVSEKMGESFKETLSNLKQTASEDNNSSSFDLSSIWKNIKGVFSSLDKFANNLPNIGTVYGIIQDPQQLYTYAGINGVSQEEQKRDQQQYNKDTHDRDYDILKVNNSYGKETSPDLINYLNRGRALELYNASYGKIDFFDLSKNYESIAKKNGIKDDRQNMQLAEYKTMLEATSSLDSGEIDNLLEQYYRDLGLSAEDTIKTINNLTTSAKNANVPLKDYVDAVSKLSEKYRLAGINGKLAQGTIDSLVGIGLNVKDAESFGNNIAAGLDKFSDNEGQVILSGLMNGKSDPFAMLWESQNTHNSDGTANKNWAHSMAQGMDTMLNFNRQIFGGGALGNYRLSQMLQKDYGFTKKQASTFINAQNEGKIDSIESLLKEVQDNKTLEEINTEMLGQLQQLNSTVSEGQKADATVQSDAFAHQEQAAQAIEQASKFLNSQLAWNNQQMQITNNLLSAYLNSSAGSFLQNNPGIAQGVQSIWDNIGNVTAIGTGIYALGKGAKKVFNKVTGRAAVETGAEMAGTLGKSSKFLKGFGKIGKMVAAAGAAFGFTEATGITNVLGLNDNNQNNLALGQQQVLAQQQAMMQQQAIMQRNNINNNSSLSLDSGIPSGTISNNAYSTQNNVYANSLSTGYGTGIGGNESFTSTNANTSYIPGQYTKDFSNGAHRYNEHVSGMASVAGTGVELGVSYFAKNIVSKVPVIGQAINGISSIAGGIADYNEKLKAGYVSGDGKNSFEKTMLNTAGDIGGTAIGAAIGSAILPGIGTFIGGALGMAVGATLGDNITKRDEELNNSVRKYKYIGWQQMLNEQYQAAGIGSDEASLMVDALKENSEVLKDQNSETRNAFAAYVAELKMNGQSTTNAWENFSKNLEQNVKSMTDKLANQGANVNNVDSKTVQDTGTTISTVNIDALEKMASVKLDNNQEIKDAIKNKKWEDLNFDLSNQDTVKDLNVRNYIANKNYDIDEIIKDARNGDSTALDAVNTISELIRNENSKTEKIGDNADERAKKEAIAAANKTGTNNLQYLTGATNGIMENILGQLSGINTDGMLNISALSASQQKVLKTLMFLSKNPTIDDKDYNESLINNIDLFETDPNKSPYTEYIKNGQISYADLRKIVESGLNGQNFTISKLGFGFNTQTINDDGTTALGRQVNVQTYDNSVNDILTMIYGNKDLVDNYLNYQLVMSNLQNLSMSNGEAKWNHGTGSVNDGFLDVNGNFLQDSKIGNMLVSEIFEMASNLGIDYGKMGKNAMNNAILSADGKGGKKIFDESKVKDYMKNSQYDDKLLEKGFKDEADILNAIKQEFETNNEYGTDLSDDTITRIITGISSAVDSAMKNNNKSTGQTALNTYITGKTDDNASAAYFNAVGQQKFNESFNSNETIKGSKLLEKDPTGKSLVNLTTGKTFKFHVDETNQYSRETMQAKSQAMIKSGEIDKPEGYKDGWYARYNQGMNDFGWFDENGNDQNIKLTGSKKADFESFANTKRGNSYDLQVIVGYNNDSGEVEYLGQKVDSKQNILSQQKYLKEEIDYMVKSNYINGEKPWNWENADIDIGELSEDTLNSVDKTLKDIKDDNADYHNSQKNQGNSNIAYLSMGQMMLSTSALGSSSYFNGQTKSVDNYEKEIQYLSKKSGLSWGYDQQGLSIGMSKNVHSVNYTSDIETINSFGKTKAKGSNMNVAIRVDGSNAISKEIYSTIIKVFQQSGIKAVLEYASQ